MIRTFKRGDRVTAVEMNEMAGALRRTDNLRAGPGLLTRRTQWGQMIELAPVAAPPAAAQELPVGFAAFRFSAIRDDYILGFPLDEQGQAITPLQQIKIAKPLGLRKSTYWNAETETPIPQFHLQLGNLEYTFPGSSIERIAENDRGNTELQIVTPLYVLQETIIAMQAPAFLTGADDIKWLETALSVRRDWAAKSNQSGD